MSSHRKVKQIILELLKDGKIHSTEEIKTEIKDNGVEISQNDSVIRNVVYKLKRDYPNFTSPERGKYKMERVNQNSDEFNDISFIHAIEIINIKAGQLKNFDWRNCSKVDLNAAHMDIEYLRNLSDKINNYFGKTTRE